MLQYPIVLLELLLSWIPPQVPDDPIRSSVIRCEDVPTAFNVPLITSEVPVANLSIIPGNIFNDRPPFTV